MVFQSHSQEVETRKEWSRKEYKCQFSVQLYVGVKICSRSIQSREGINYTQIELCFKMGRVEGV